MERITNANQFIDGKGYYCKDKLSGKLTINYVYNDGERRFFSKNRFWLTDAANIDKIFRTWDIIGPIPEIKDDIILTLFNYPYLTEVFSRPMWIREDGSVIIYDDDFLNMATLAGYDIYDKEDIARHFCDDRVDTEDDDDVVKEMPFKMDGEGNVVLSDFKFKEDIKYKVGNYIKLKIDLHNEEGYFPTGSVLKILDKYNHGYIVGNDYMKVFASQDCFDIIIIHG